MEQKGEKQDIRSRTPLTCLREDVSARVCVCVGGGGVEEKERVYQEHTAHYHLPNETGGLH